MDTSKDKVIVQRLGKVYKHNLELAERYYIIISAINDLRLTEREIQLISFIAVNGSISYATVKEDFCKIYSTSPPTINNIISKLKRGKVLVKDKGKIKVNPLILLNFNNDVILQIQLTHFNNVNKDS